MAEYFSKGPEKFLRPFAIFFLRFLVFGRNANKLQISL